MSDSAPLAKPEKQFQAKITDLLLNVDSEHIKNNAQNVVCILSLFSEISQVHDWSVLNFVQIRWNPLKISLSQYSYMNFQLTLELYTPEMALVNEPCGGLTFRDLPFWAKLDTLKLNSNTPISDDLIRYCF